MTLLDRQVQILSIDTGNFYSHKEAHLHWLNHKLRSERAQLINGSYNKDSNGKIRRRIIGTKEIETEFDKYGIGKNEINLIQKQEYDFYQHGENTDALIKLADSYCHLKNLIEIKNNTIKKTKNDLLQLLKNKVESNIQSNGRHHIRTLQENQVSSKNIISVFDSSFTRMIGAKQDELCEDFMVVQVYYFDIIN